MSVSSKAFVAETATGKLTIYLRRIDRHCGGSCRSQDLGWRGVEMVSWVIL